MAPAIIWTGESTPSIHYSEATEVASVIKSALPKESSLSSAVFVLGRDQNGNDGLSALSSSGSLPRTESKYSSAHSVHHFVLGTENAQSVTDNARLVVGNSRNVIETTLHEFTKVDRSGDIFVIYLPVVNDSKEIDSVIASSLLFAPWTSLSLSETLLRQNEVGTPFLKDLIPVVGWMKREKARTMKMLRTRM